MYLFDIRSFLAIILLLNFTCHSFAHEVKGVDAVRDYVNSLEWDEELSHPLVIDNEIEQYRHWLSVSGEMAYYAAVMVGIRRLNALLPEIKNLPCEDDAIAIGKTFALARLGYEVKDNVARLQNYGSITQDAGGAKSLRNLNAIELLSLIEDRSFCPYLRRIAAMTDEVFQREAIEVAGERYAKQFGYRCGSSGSE